MKRVALAAFVVVGLAPVVGQSSASPLGHWVMTDVAAQARLEFPHYTGLAFIGMTSGGRVILTAQRPGGGSFDRDVFQWQSGRITHLGSLPRHSFPLGFNAGGAIVGSSEDPPYCPPYGPIECTPGPAHAYLWQPGKTTLLPTLGGASSEAGAINSRGQVVGDSETPTGQRRGVLWEDGKVIDLGAADPWAINDNGEILEDVHAKKGYETVLWRKGKTTPIKLPIVDVRTLNNRGEVIGDYTKPGQLPHAFIWQSGRVTDLGATFGGYPMAINDRGDVVEPEQTSRESSRGILWHGGKNIDLGTLGGPLTFPIALNTRGQVVGISTLRGSTFQRSDRRAFIWQNGEMRALPSNGSILKYDAVMSINAAGTLIAAGTWPFMCDEAGCGGQLFVWRYVR